MVLILKHNDQRYLETCMCQVSLHKPGNSNANWIFIVLNFPFIKEDYEAQQHQNGQLIPEYCKQWKQLKQSYNQTLRILMNR